MAPAFIYPSQSFFFKTVHLVGAGDVYLPEDKNRICPAWPPPMERKLYAISSTPPSIVNPSFGLAPQASA